MGILLVALTVWVVWLIQRQRYYRKWKDGLSIQVEFMDSYVAQNTSTKLRLSITNNKKLMLPCVGFKFKTSRFLQFEDALQTSVSDYFYRHDIMSVGSYQKVIRRLNLRAAHRGKYTIDDVEIICHDTLFTQTFLEIIPMNTQMCVYPAYVDIKKIFPLVKNGTGEIWTRRRLFEDPFSMEGIREYTPNDRMKNIHWKASARTGTLQVTIPPFTTSQKMWVILSGMPCGRGQNDAEQEEEIRLAYSFCDFICKKEIPFSLLTNFTVQGEKKLYSHVEGTGKEYLHLIQENMACLDSEIPPEPMKPVWNKFYSRAKRGEFAVVVSANQRPEQQETILNGIRAGIDMIWVIPIVYTTEIFKEIQVLPELMPYVFIWQYER